MQVQGRAVPEGPRGMTVAAAGEVTGEVAGDVASESVVVDESTTAAGGAAVSEADEAVTVPGASERPWWEGFSDEDFVVEVLPDGVHSGCRMCEGLVAIDPDEDVEFDEDEDDTDLIENTLADEADEAGWEW